MERIEKTVFLSYRRTNIPWALAIFQNLTQHGYDVFFDYNGLGSGDFERAILGNITARAHFIVLLTPSALERCDDPNDWLRREIETALNSQRNTVPLMLEGFDFGTPKIANQLTGKLAALKHYNGLSIPPEYFLEAMERLRGRYLNIPLTAVMHPASPVAQKAAREQQTAARAAPPIRSESLPFAGLFLLEQDSVEWTAHLKDVGDRFEVIWKVRRQQDPTLPAFEKALALLLRRIRFSGADLLHQFAENLDGDSPQTFEAFLVEQMYADPEIRKLR